MQDNTNRSATNNYFHCPRRAANSHIWRSNKCFLVKWLKRKTVSKLLSTSNIAVLSKYACVYLCICMYSMCVKIYKTYLLKQEEINKFSSLNSDRNFTAETKLRLNCRGRLRPSIGWYLLPIKHVLLARFTALLYFCPVWPRSSLLGSLTEQNVCLSHSIYS